MNFPSIMLFCCLIFFLPNNSITSWFENHALYFEIYASVSVQLKTHPIEFTVTAKWGSPFSLGQSPEYTRRRLCSLPCPRLVKRALLASVSPGPGSLLFPYGLLFYLLLTQPSGQIPTPSPSFLLKNGWREGGSGGREREGEPLSPPPHRTAIKEHMYQLKKFLGNKSFLIEHSLFSQLM